MKKYSTSFRFLFILMILLFANCESDEDVTQNFIAPSVPVAPLNGDTRVTRTPTLEWQGRVALDPETVTYDIYLDVNPNPSRIIASNQTTLSYTVKENLEAEKIYYWKVVSRSGQEAAESRIFSFQTIPAIFTPPSDITILNTNPQSLTIGVQVQLEAVISPEDTFNKTISWSSTDSRVVTVTTQGIIKAVSKGTAQVIASTIDGQFSDNITIEVLDDDIQVEEVNIQEQGFQEVEIGKTIDFTAVVRPSDASDKEVVWSSLSSSIATVVGGRVTGVGPGSTTITAASKSNPAINSKIVINVVRPTPPAADIVEQLSFQGHKYYVIRNTVTWQVAADYAYSYGGHLVHITSLNEQREIETLLTEALKDPNISNATVGGDGGDSIYFWIGATDKDSEGRWVWDGDNRNSTIAPVFGNYDKTTDTWSLGTDPLYIYENWGTRIVNTNEELTQPNDDGNNQDYAAISSKAWKSPTGEDLGRQFEWNDLNNTSLLFIVEVDTP